jgi:hypothetical protein
LRYTSPIEAETDEVQWEKDTGAGRVRAAAYLTILNTELPPNELARLVGLEPDESWTKGDLRRPGRQHPFNGVAVQSKLDEKRSPTDHFDALIEILTPYADQIAKVAALPSTQIAKVTVAEHSERDNVDAWADPERLAIVVKMGAVLFFDAYFYDLDDDENG